MQILRLLDNNNIHKILYKLENLGKSISLTQYYKCNLIYCNNV